MAGALASAGDLSPADTAAELLGEMSLEGLPFVVLKNHDQYTDDAPVALHHGSAAAAFS